MSVCPNLTSATPEEARAQIGYLQAPKPADASKLVIVGRKGQAYVKVWRDKPVALLLFCAFVPGSSSEKTAYKKAAEVMRDNPGARWAVSTVCEGACAGLPVVAEGRRMRNPTNEQRKAFGPEERSLLTALASCVGPIDARAENRDLLVHLTLFAFAFEVAPGQWAATESGRDWVAKRAKVKK